MYRSYLFTLRKKKNIYKKTSNLYIYADYVADHMVSVCQFFTLDCCECITCERKHTLSFFVFVCVHLLNLPDRTTGVKTGDNKKKKHFIYFNAFFY